jgi:pimeloyl-ACP methyl ester carboxylesterase
MRGVQKARPSLYDLREELARLTAPTLLVAGDEDEGCLETSLMLKRTIPPLDWSSGPARGTPATSRSRTCSTGRWAIS